MTELHPDKIVEVVSHVTDVDVKVLLSDDRHKHIARARFAAYYVLRENRFSYPVIGASLGNRDHTTAMAGYKKAAILYQSEPSFQQLIRTITVGIERAKEIQMPAPATFEEFHQRCIERCDAIQATKDEGLFAQRYYEDVTILLRLIQGKNETPDVLYQRSL